MRALLLADDHPLVCDGVRNLVGQLPEAPELHVVHDAEGLWDACARRTWDLVLLDLQMPGMAARGGLEGWLQAFGATQPAALFSGLVSPRDAQLFRERGGRGLLPKSLTGAALRGALELLLAGQRWFAEAPPRAASIEHLTPRQREVFALLVEGHSNKAIAQRLQLSVGTVKNHVRDIYLSLDVENRHQALRLALTS